MKNKHLLLLFLGTLAAGFLVRRLPWPLNRSVRADLIEVDTAAVTRIAVFLPGQPELSLERTESGWVAAQDNHSVAIRAESIDPILKTLAAVRSRRIEKTDRPDTLGFSAGDRVQIVVFQEDKMLEQFEIGFEIQENGSPATYVHLTRHEGYYLADGHLRQALSRKSDDFRDGQVARFQAEAVTGILFEWRENGVPVQYPLYRDSAGLWQSPGLNDTLPGDSVRNWLALFGRLNGSPFADYFDDSRTGKTFLHQVTLQVPSQEPLILKVFYIKPPDLPEEISTVKAGKLPVYVLHSSQNPANYFAPADTALLRKVCYGLLPESEPLK